MSGQSSPPGGGVSESTMYFNIIKSIISKKIGLHPHPHFVTYFATWRCNCKCVFCDVWKKIATKSEELSVEELSRIFSGFSELDVLRITGGEPFLRNDLHSIVNEINDACRPSIIHITSNGMLTGKIISTMENVLCKNKVHIKISIDEIGSEHDSIRGVVGVYDRAVETVHELVALARHSPGFTVGINQAIARPEALRAYEELKRRFMPLGVKVYPVIAHKAGNALYGKDAHGKATNMRFEPYGDFSKDELSNCLNTFYKDSLKNGCFSEKIVDRYYQRGLRNRLLLGKNKPHPKCVALADHLRILPNGDIPICYFNDKVVANLRQAPWTQSRQEVAVKNARQWVNTCPGCWESCEVVPSAAYTGDLIKGLL